MMSGLDIVSRERARRGDNFRSNLAALRQRLRRGEPGANNRAGIFQQLQRHQPGLFLEQQRIAHGATKEVSILRQDEGGTDIRVAGERKLRLGVKIRTSAVWAASIGGSTKVVSDKLNSAAIDCIAAVAKPSAFKTTAKGFPAKSSVGEDVNRYEIELHCGSSLFVQVR